MKTLYIRNILLDLWKERKKAAIFVVVCVIVSVCLALRPGTPANLSDEQKEELAAYQEQMEEYEAAIRDVKTSIEDNQKQIDDLKDYIDHSIYMQIDPNSIQTAAIQYSLQTDGNVGNILNSFITYINDGGMRESVAEEDKDLQPEYWRDIIGSYISANILNITVVHYDAEKCARILEIVKQRIQEHVPEVKAAQGDFTLTEMETTQFVKADAGMVNNQNGHRNNLKNYEAGLADLRNRLVSYRTNRANYKKNNEPDFASETEEKPTVRVVKYLLVGILMGVVLACAAVILRYILSDRLQSAADLRDVGLNVLGICRSENGDLSFQPEPARAALDIQILAGAKGKDSVFFDRIHEDALCEKAAEAYAAALSETGITTRSGSKVSDSAEELKTIIETGSCLLVAEAGKTTYPELKQHMELCERFRVAVLGCVVIE